MRRACTSEHMFAFPPKRVEMCTFPLKGENASLCQSVCIFYTYNIDDVKLAQLVRARDCRSRGRRFDPA